MVYNAVVNGFEIRASIRNEDREELLLPVLRFWAERSREKQKAGERYLVFLAGPPATGKSTLAACLERISREEPDCVPVQAVGMDGFHYPEEYLRSHTALREGREISLRSIKGAPESFDFPAMKRCLEKIHTRSPLFPVYDRRIHDVVPDAIEVRERIILFEGNYLLLDSEPWRGLTCDYSILLTGDARMLEERVVERKIRGGFGEKEARAFAAGNDRFNIEVCRKHSREPDLCLRVGENGELRKTDWKETVLPDPAV